MKLSRLMLFNALLFVALGIAFALYAPLMLPLYHILEAEGGVALYWYTVSFARLLGAALFGFGFLLWALHREVEIIPPERKRRLLQALLLSYFLSLMVTLVQQVSIWGTALGWFTTGVPFILLLGYTYIYIKPG